MPIIHDISLTLAAEHVLRREGVSKRSKLQPGILAVLNELLASVNEFHLLEPAIVYELYLIMEVRRNQMLLEGDSVLHGKLLPRVLSSAKELAVVVCTIGSKLEEKVAEYLTHNEQLRGLLLDGIGSAAVDSVAQQACHLMRDEALSRGYQASSPLSPGMPGLDILEQLQLFRLVPAEQIGVRLIESAMIVPRKSVSMVIGMGPEMPTWTQEEVCNRCSMKNTCDYRVYSEQNAAPESKSKGT